MIDIDRKISSLEDEELTFEGKVFYSKKKLTSLIKLLSRVEESKVICVDGEWGTGKSFFCKAFEKYGSDFFKVIYFDSYKADFNSDPLIAILSEILLTSKGGEDESKKREFAKLAQPFLGRGLKTLGDIVPLPGASYVGNELSLMIEGMIENYTSMDDSVSGLRNELVKIVKEQESKKVVFVVDELDRCRPSYALEVIEKIKHVFDVDGISFVLSMNKQQFLSSIEHAYGISGRRESYLEKFVDITLRLNNASRVSSLNGRYIAEVEYCKTLFSQRFEFLRDAPFIEIGSRYAGLITYKQGLSFRDVDRFVDNCVTCFLVSEAYDDGPYKAAHACFLCCCVFSVTNSPETMLISGDGETASTEFCRLIGISGYLSAKKAGNNTGAYQLGSRVSDEEASLGGRDFLGIIGTIGEKKASNHPGHQLLSYVESLQINIGGEHAKIIFKKWAEAARMIG